MMLTNYCSGRRGWKVRGKENGIESQEEKGVKIRWKGGEWGKEEIKLDFEMTAHSHRPRQ